MIACRGVPACSGPVSLSLPLSLSLSLALSLSLSQTHTQTHTHTHTHTHTDTHIHSSPFNPSALSIHHICGSVRSVCVCLCVCVKKWTTLRSSGSRGAILWALQQEEKE